MKEREETKKGSPVEATAGQRREEK